MGGIGLYGELQETNPSMARVSLLPPTHNWNRLDKNDKMDRTADLSYIDTRVWQAKEFFSIFQLLKKFDQTISQFRIRHRLTGPVSDHHQVATDENVLIGSETFTYLTLDSIAFNGFLGNTTRNNYPETRLRLVLCSMNQNSEMPV